MKRRHVVMAMFPCLLSSAATLAHDTYVAFSIREAQRQAEAGAHNMLLHSLGGVTRVVGMVCDEEGSDVILVGRREATLPPARLDDLVVALRARMVQRSWPMVSIDPTADTPRTGRQTVTFGGGVADCGFGQDFLQCDVLLKRYSLGLLRPTKGVKPYPSLYVDELRSRARADGRRIVEIRWLQAGDQAAEATKQRHDRIIRSQRTCQLRFWFFPYEPFLFLVRDGVFVIRELRLMVRLQVTPPAKQSREEMAQTDDFLQAGQKFALQFTQYLPAVSADHPQLKRLKILYDLVAAAEGIRTLKSRPDLTYFLQKHPVRVVKTPTDHELIKLQGFVQCDDGTEHAVSISGGVRFATQLRWLNDGDVTPLQEIVLETRPKATSLCWPLPLEAWDVPNCQDLPALPEVRGYASNVIAVPEKAPACQLAAQEYLLEPEIAPGGAGQPTFVGFGARIHPLPSVGVAPTIEYRADVSGTARFRVKTDDLGGVYIDAGGRRLDPSSVSYLLDQLRTQVIRNRPTPESPQWDIDIPEEVSEDD